MKDTNPSDIFLEDLSDKEMRKNRLSGDALQSNSFADQFIKTKSKQKKENFQQLKSQASFDVYDMQTHANGDVVDDVHDKPRSKVRLQKNLKIDKTDNEGYESGGESNYKFTAIHNGEKKPSVNWNFLDLRNRKQTGDLYKKILHFNKKNGSQAFCFTSSRGGEGVTTTLVNLVEYIRNQATDKTIMVIDTNFQSPGLYKVFNIPDRTHNIIDIFNNRIGIRDALTAISSNIFVLTCGNPANNKAGNIEPDNVVKLFNQCRKLVDYVLIDCPPVLSSSDSMSVAPAADISFMVIQSVKVQRPVAQKAISLLQDNECEIGGVILNRVQQVIPGWVYKFI